MPVRWMLAVSVAAGSVVLAMAGGCTMPNSSPLRTAPAAFGPSSSLDRILRSPHRSHPGVRSWIRPLAKTQKLVYISDYEHDSISIFDATSGALVGQIGNLSAAAGLFVDGHHRLWVANSGASDVLVFPRGSMTPKRTLSDPSERPFDVSVCPNGTVYVSNYYSFTSGIGDVAVYSHGSLTPTGTLSDPNEFENYFITCDKAGNVFTTLETGNLFNQVDEYAGGAGPAVTLFTVDQAGGIQVDNAGNLVVSDPDAHTITEYTESGTPTGNGFPTGTTHLVFGISVSRSSKTVVGADAGGRGLLYALWSGAQVQTYNGTFSEPLGAAYDPGQKGI